MMNEFNLAMFFPDLFIDADEHPWASPVDLVLPCEVPENVHPSLKEFCDSYDSMLDQFIFIGDFS